MNIDRKQIVLVCVIIAMIAGFFFLQYVPTMSALKEAKASAQEQQLRRVKVDSDLQKLPDLMDKLGVLKSKVGDFENRIPVQGDLGTFLQDIAVKMEKHSLGDQVVKPSDEKQYAEVNSIPVMIECSGKLGEIFEFFKDIESGQRIFRIEQVRFENREYDGNIKVYAKGSVFYRQEM